jgi:hypothetical protein
LFGGVVKAKVPDPDGGAVELTEAAALQGAVDAGIGEVGVVEDLSPGIARLVSGEVGREAGVDERAANCRLEGEAELVDGL